jgi:5-formyltetrahydrofolate cyclo-ligase
MQMGAFRIEEPTGDDVTDPGCMEMIIVPAVAYDRSGNRVGRGKGYYDRLLARTSAFTVGVAYDFQLVDEIDTDEFDIPVDMVITETHTVVRRR